MNVKSILIGSIIIGILSLSGCVATPYYGGLGYYRNTAHGYGHQSPIYINPGYIGVHKHFIGGSRHMRGDTDTLSVDINTCMEGIISSGDTI